ncbi:MAG TPA: hypothetical protein VG055_15300, partial [Planctomycetaceae bacterium]|nr:hypothetical protein [Planctomycetaceae bacterium]
RFTPMAILTAAVAISMAFVLGACRFYGYYEIRATPFLVTLPAAGMAYLAIVLGRCRHDFVAGTFGFVVLSVIFWGQFPSALALEAGPDALLSPREVVGYMKWRMNNEMIVSFGSTPVWRRDRIEPSVNWVIAVFTWYLVTAPLVVLLVWRSRRLYCERCLRWTNRDVLKLPRKAGGKALELFEAGKLDQIDQKNLGAVDQGLRTPAWAWLRVEFCAKRQGAEPCPVFFTIFDSSFWYSKARGPRIVAGQPVGVLGYVLKRLPLDEQQIKTLSRTFVRLDSSR